MTSKHVAFIISSLGAGGAESVIAQLARHWIGLGHRVTLVSFDDPREPVFHDFPEQVHFERLAIPVRKGPIQSTLSILKRIARLRRVIQQGEPDVVFSFLTKINLIALLAGLRTGVPVVCSERNNPERQGTHPLWNVLLSLAYRRARLIVCQTEGVVRCFPEPVRQRIRVIPNPIRLHVRTGAGSEGPYRLTAVGRLTRQKGFDLLIEAFARLRQRFGDWQLVIWGEGADRPVLEAMIREHRLEGAVNLCGTGDRPGSWVEATDLFVLPSRYEGFPNVLGEAMAAGIAAVSAECDFGPREMITHEVDGLLVPPENSLALEKGLERLMRDAAFRERLGRAAAQSARRFAPEKVLPLWDDALALAVGKPVATPGYRPESSVHQVEPAQ